MFDIMTQSFRYWLGYCGTGGAAVCTTQAFFSNVFTISSMVVVLVMSGERFCALRLPFRYDRYFSMRNTGWILVGLLAYSVSIHLEVNFGLTSTNGRDVTKCLGSSDVTKWAIIDVNSIVSGRNYCWRRGHSLTCAKQGGSLHTIQF